jgi:hypothetical protein
MRKTSGEVLPSSLYFRPLEYRRSLTILRSVPSLVMWELLRSLSSIYECRCDVCKIHMKLVCSRMKHA